MRNHHFRKDGVSSCLLQLNLGAKVLKVAEKFCVLTVASNKTLLVSVAGLV